MIFLVIRHQWNSKPNSWQYSIPKVLTFVFLYNIKTWNKSSKVSYSACISLNKQITVLKEAGKFHLYR